MTTFITTVAGTSVSALSQLVPAGPDRMVVITCLVGTLLMPFLL